MSLARGFRHVGQRAGRTSPTWALKKTLASMIVLGSMSYLTVGGVFAIFNGTASNSASTAATGTLALSNSVNSGTACFSYGTGSTGNANPSCNGFITHGTLRYPGQTVTTTIAIKNTGSLKAQDLILYMPICTSTTSPSAAYVGGTALCGASSGLQMFVQETSSSGGAAVACLYPTGYTTCPAAGASFYTFVSNAYSVVHYLDLGAGPTAGTTRFFTIAFFLPSAAASSLQGEEADFSLTWHAQTTP